MSRKPLFIALSLMAVMLVACRPRPLFHAYQSVPSEGWERTDTLRFQFPVVPADDWYDFSLGLRFSEPMPYAVVHLVVERRDSSFTRPQRDTLHVRLADSRGRWRAQGVVLHDMEIPLRSDSLHAASAPLFLVYHIMRRPDLPALTEVGIKAEQHH